MEPVNQPPMPLVFDALSTETFNRMELKSPANRITSMVQGAATTNYTYNGVGNLTLEAQGAAQTGYVYDGENRLLQLTNPDGTVITNTYAGDGLRRTTQQPGKAASTIVWDGQDYLGQS
jgi:YD repeat-containing protein